MLRWQFKWFSWLRWGCWWGLRWQSWLLVLWCDSGGVVEVMRWRWFGVEVLRYWCGQCRVIEFFIRYLILWPFSNLLRFAGLSFWVTDGFQICWDLQVSLYLIEFDCIGVECLEVVCKLRFIYLGSRSTGVLQLLIQGAVFWTLMGRSLLIRDWELVSSDISSG
jgi:hypothetical protein